MTVRARLKVQSMDGLRYEAHHVRNVAGRKTVHEQRSMSLPTVVQFLVVAGTPSCFSMKLLAFSVPGPDFDVFVPLFSKFLIFDFKYVMPIAVNHFRIVNFRYAFFLKRVVKMNY